MPAPSAEGLGIEIDDAIRKDLEFKPLREGDLPFRDDGSVAYSV